MHFSGKRVYPGKTALVVVKPLLLCLLIFTVNASRGSGEGIQEPLLPIPKSAGLPADKASLGDRLFHDPRLSTNNSISCAHCHELASGGTDNLNKSVGVDGAVGVIKAPTVYNSGFNFVQFWDGRAATLEEQIDGPVNNPVEMSSNWVEVISKLQADASMVAAFSEIYPDGITPVNIKNAIATFERSLVTADSRFDQWLRGDETALNATELEGYRLFKDYGCVSCHQGKNVGGNMYGYMGAMGNYFADRGGELNQGDLGRFNVTGLLEDRHLFKVPSLRLVVLNAPYFHDGSAATLQEAIEIMARYQLGRKIPEQEIQAIIAFFHALVGEHPRLHR